MNGNLPMGGGSTMVMGDLVFVNHTEYGNGNMNPMQRQQMLMMQQQMQQQQQFMLGMAQAVQTQNKLLALGAATIAKANGGVLEGLMMDGDTQPEKISLVDNRVIDGNVIVNKTETSDIEEVVECEFKIKDEDEEKPIEVVIKDCTSKPYDKVNFIDHDKIFDGMYIKASLFKGSDATQLIGDGVNKPVILIIKSTYDRMNNWRKIFKEKYNEYKSSPFKKANRFAIGYTPVTIICVDKDYHYHITCVVPFNGEIPTYKDAITNPTIKQFRDWLEYDNPLVVTGVIEEATVVFEPVVDTKFRIISNDHKNITNKIVFESLYNDSTYAISAKDYPLFIVDLMD